LLISIEAIENVVLAGKINVLQRFAHVAIASSANVTLSAIAPQSRITLQRMLEETTVVIRYEVARIKKGVVMFIFHVKDIYNQIELR
jgi:hypothetical protein